MITNYFSRLMVDNLFVSKGNTMPASYYVGLSSTLPSATGAGVTEPSSSVAYKRVLVGATKLLNDSTICNSDVIAFPKSTGAWGRVPYYVVYDKERGGNLLFFGNLTPIKTIEKGTLVSIPVEKLTVQIRGE